MEKKTPHLDEPVSAFARTDFPVLQEAFTVGDALNYIREHGIGERIVYFYVTDQDNHLTGVLPTRRLLTSRPEEALRDVMIRKVVGIPSEATVMEACEYFIMHKYLAFPVLTAERKLVGVVDISQFTDEVFDLAEREQADAVFETLGFRVSQVKDASPFKAFRFRFPWLLATIASGTACALLSGVFQDTLAASLVIAFFLALVLALGESVSIQSATLAIQLLRIAKPTWGWYLKTLGKETMVSVLLGLGCGLVVGLIVWLWRGDPAAAGVVGVSILLSITSASFFGLSVPCLLHAWKLDPRIAAGPVTLALADVTTLLIYFSLATAAL